MAIRDHGMTRLLFFLISFCVIYIKRGAILDDYEFELLEHQNREVVSVKYRGVWVIVDNDNGFMPGPRPCHHLAMLSIRMKFAGLSGLNQ